MRPFVLTLSLLLVCGDVLAGPAAHRAKAATVPDFLQTDREAGFAKSGFQFCAPTAVSNSLMWLADHGYDDLRPSGSAKRAQIEMIRQLSGPRFMKTSPAIGTDVAQVLAGVQAYVEDAGYTISELTYEGWRPVPEESFTSEVPDLEDIKTTVAGDQGAVWLNVGWYAYDEENDAYVRKGGHWVTVVGYDHDDLLIHDPSPSAGPSFRTQRITLDELAEGTLTGNQRNLPRAAEGYYEVGGEMAVGAGWTCILDGVVLLTLE
ncbi:MAG: hypothetical protein ABI779_11745 [Acidobacteriota bacterium]